MDQTREHSYIDQVLVGVRTLEVAYEFVGTGTEEDFALARRQGLGASDASVYLGLQTQWKSTPELIAEKLRTGYTEEEQAIAMKDVVRKGKDLEPLNLQKAAEKLGMPVHKPEHMYRIQEFPYLLVNFDGVLISQDRLIPVEAKFVSMYGDKYYDFTRTQADLINWDEGYNIERKASIVGIPPYYYAQVQQQILALDAPHGYLSVLRDKGWEHHMFVVPRDNVVIRAIILEGFKVWNQITAKRTGGL